MNRIFLLLAAVIASGTVCAQQIQGNDSIKPFVGFLNSNSLPGPKEYVLKSFEKYDIIILSERHHRELTQYELITDILKDAGFHGNVYTEIGIFNIRDRIRSFLTKEGLTKDEKEKELIQIYRDLDYQPIWENYNFYFLLSSIYDINQGRPANDKIMLVPLDMVFYWDSIGCNDQYKMLMDMMEPRQGLPPVISRNDVMAQHFTREYYSERSRGKVKALVILNTYHGYTRIPEYRPNPSEPSTYSTAQYIYKSFPGKTKGILINGYIFHPKFRLVAGGKWDAAFRVTGNHSAGFDLRDTPFGKTRFDMYNFGGSDYRTVDFEYIFDGLIFHTPVEDFTLATGIPGFFDDPAFVEQFYRRTAISMDIPEGEVRKSDEIRNFMESCNKLRIEKTQETDELNREMNQWLKK